MPEVTMLVDYQGQYSGPHFWQSGQVVAVDASTAARLIADGRAVGEQDSEKPTINYKKMTTKQLRSELLDQGLAISGNKSEMVERLENADVN